MITFEDILKANKLIKSTTLKRKNKDGSITSKDYAEVPQRVKAFRSLYPDGLITTEIIEHADNEVLMMARVFDDDNKLLSTGLALENKDVGLINKTSYIENCETSAVGRALGFLALGSDTSIASYEEVTNAIEAQERLNGNNSTPTTETPVKTAENAPKGATGKQLNYINKLFASERKDAILTFCDYNGFDPHHLTVAQASMIIKEFGNA